MRIALGSTSHVKQAALKSAFAGCTVLPFASPSGVPEQPVGKAQTLEGASNRCNGARQAALESGAEFDLCVGIENGMWKSESGDGMVDGAAIVVEDARDGRWVVWSDELPIPADHPPGPFEQWSALTDPHSVVTGGKRSRAQFLADALTQWAQTRKP